MKVRTGFRLPESLNEFLKNAAKRKGVTKNALVIEIFWEYFEKRSDQQKP